MAIPHKCPVCDGTGLVRRPPGVAGDQESWTDSGTGPYPCRACAGTGIVWQPEESIPTFWPYTHPESSGTITLPLPYTTWSAP